MDLLWLIPVLPLLGAALNGVFGKRLSKSIVTTIALGTVGLSFLLALREFVAMLRLAENQLPILRDYFAWIQAGRFQAQFGFMLDHLSGLMILVVTGVGFLIHVYSAGYMQYEEGFYRYFAYLNLFVFFMLTLVLADNYLLMFVGWEGVGLCSYLLIGFWFTRKSAADAAKKAFVVNRIGDFGFILAIMLIYWTFERIDFAGVFLRLENSGDFAVEPLGSVGVLTAIGLLLFAGAAGKSAQFPLYVWLPDAMEGPTPVSALIHAGTLAIAGFPPLAGFFSKDAVLGGAWNYGNYGRVLWFVGVLAASFTSFYMFRLLILTFYGTPRYTEQEVHHVHESPNSMLMPLVILAVCSILAGFAGVPPVLGGDNHIQQFLTPAAHEVKSESLGTTAIELILMAVSTGAALAGAGLAYLFYIARPTLPETLSAKAHSMYSIMLNKFYVDEIYDAVVVWPVVRMSSEFLWKFVDMFMIDGAVNGIGQLVRGSGSGLRYMQSGYVRTYAGWILLGGVLVIAWFLK